MSVPGTDAVPQVMIGDRPIGPGRPTWLVAEMSGNHGGSLDRALAMVDAVAAAGADAVKIQVYRPDTITLDSDRPDFRIAADNAWAGHRTLYQLYEEAHTPWEWLPALFRRAAEHGLPIFGSVFDETSVDALEELQVPAYKIAAPEICDRPLLQRVAATGKPVLVSTGVATLADVAQAYELLMQEGAGGVVLLKCSTAYPAPPEEINLRTIPHMQQAFSCPVGFSDHTLGIGIALAAIGLGATVIEKHVKLADAPPAVDDFFSLTTAQFAILVEESRRVQRALGTVDYSITPSSRANAAGRRSLYVAAPIAAGAPFTVHNIRSVRPGHGLDTRYRDIVLGRRAARDLAPGERLAWDVID
ncbi:MAG: pseudaminic acid synthase [Planctomycetota bacterium]